MSEKYERVALQDPTELAHFIKLLRKESIKSYLEIGCKHGGSLWRIATEVLPKGSRVVAVDLPHGDHSFKESLPHLQACVKRLQKWYDAHLFIGDSTDDEIVAKVSVLGPYDLCLIDANHTEPYVRKDWANYGSMSRIVAFHDVGWDAQGRDTKYKMPIHVPIIWAEIKQQFRHKEIRNCPRDNGIGVLWRC